MNLFRKNNTSLLLVLLTFSMILLTACDKDETPDPAVPNAPTLNAASDIVASGFKASWSAVANVDKYLLDVSAKEDFSTTITGYNKKEVTGTSQAITGLTANTKYYIRIYAKSGTITSAASAIKDVTTSPEAPVLNAAAEIITTGFKVTWSAIANVDKYMLDVSLQENFSTFVTGYSKKEITGTSEVIAGLTANTKYYFRVFAKRGSQSSAASATKEVTTKQ